MSYLQESLLMLNPLFLIIEIYSKLINTPTYSLAIFHMTPLQRTVSEDRTKSTLEVITAQFSVQVLFPA